MALVSIPPSPVVLETYRESLRDRGMPDGEETTLIHLPVGVLALDGLAAGATLRDLARAGCRFVAGWRDGSWTSCEMTDESQYGSAKFRNFATGEAAERVAQRIAEAKLLPEVRHGDYLLHFLSAPGILCEGLHLVRQGAGADLVLLTRSLSAALPEDEVLDDTRFVTAAAALAGARLAHRQSKLRSTLSS